MKTKKIRIPTVLTIDKRLSVESAVYQDMIVEAEPLLLSTHHTFHAFSRPYTQGEIDEVT